MTIKELQLLIDTVYKHYKVAKNPEITLEANPDDLSKQKLNDLKTAQINRLSIGIQSFFEDDLKSMNRAHSSQESIQCLEEATKHFDNITIDLIYGIPNMSLEKWNKNLQITFNFGINHISSYALTVEPKTALGKFIKRGTYLPINEELTLQHFNHLVTESEKKGFVHYEISNFGKDGYFSKHNTSYWQAKSYLGIGPSSHSFNGYQRSWNVSNNAIYIKSIQDNKLPSEVETLSKKDTYNEYLMTGLRTIWGISLDKVERDFGVNYNEQLIASAEKFIDQGLLMSEDGKLLTTKNGKFLVDGIASDLFMI